jgi:FkbH-like protein
MPRPVQVFRGLGIDILHPRISLPHFRHAATDPRQRLQDRIDLRPVRLQVRAARFCHSIQLAVAVRAYRSVADFLQIGQCRINHSGARRVKTARSLFKNADQLIAVRRRLGQQSKQHELQIRRAHPPADRKPVIAHEAAPMPAALAAAAFTPPPLATCAAAPTPSWPGFAVPFPFGVKLPRRVRMVVLMRVRPATVRAVSGVMRGRMQFVYMVVRHIARYIVRYFGVKLAVSQPIALPRRPMGRCQALASQPFRITGGLKAGRPCCYPPARWRYATSGLPRTRMKTTAIEPIRLVIWDLDDTLWRGTLTEGGIGYRQDLHNTVMALARRGIISSICSKHDRAPVQDLLTDKGLWGYFVFPSINWDAKGPRLAALIEAVQLRPTTVLFIDDNPHNLAEAQHFVPGLQVATPEILPDLLDHPLCRGKDDAQLTRLQQYQLLEKRQTASATTGDATAFLRASAIQVEISFDLDPHLDRAIELINRTNQLNFTKNRLSENPDAARKELRRLILNQNYPAGILRVRDNYGDYGFCGLYVLNHQRGRPLALIHFCFSCRILGMGVETWLYRRLGRPALAIQGEVLNDPVQDMREIDWITVAELGSGVERQFPPGQYLDIVYARGACHVRPLSHYFGMVAAEVVEDFDTARNGRTMPLNHSIFAHYALHGLPEQARSAMHRLGYSDEDFTSFITRAPHDKRMLWVLNFWTEAGNNLYRHRETGALIPIAFNPDAAKHMHKKLGPAAADARNWDIDAPGVDPAIIETLRAEFEHAGNTPDQLLKRTIADMIAAAPPGTMVILLLANDQRLAADGTISTATWVTRINRLVTQAAANFPAAILLDVRECILSNDDLVVDAPLKFQRAVFFRLYEAIIRRWNEAQEARASF